MEKSKINYEDWILIALINASERYGVSLIKWFFKRPDELNIGQDQFFKIIDKMEMEGIIRRASSDSVNYCLSEKGKKDAIRLKRRLNFNDYYFVISKFPEIEFRERIETIEIFIITSFLLILIYYWGKIPVSAYGNNFYVFMGILTVFTIIFTLILFHFTFNFVKIIFFWTVSLQRDTLWIYKEWLWNNRNKFIYPIPAFLVILMLFGLYNMGIPWQSIVTGLFMIVIGIFIANYNKIVSRISNFISGKKQ